jgi:RNA polymerase sigma-70 factor, ECF subfamily
VTVPGDAAAEVASVVARERPAMVATLIRLTGDWDLAEEAVQDAVERALARWPAAGLPRSPAAWLTTVARNRALDVVRRRRTERAKVEEAALMAEWGAVDSPRDPMSDDVLRLLFTCCHPALAIENRVALTLKVAAGLSTAEIGRAFLVSEATLSQRLLRTKRKIANAGIPFRLPPDDLLAERTAGVRAVLYLAFNEGHGRREHHVATEARRVTGLLVDLMPHDDEALGLLALMTLHLARRATRFDAGGHLVPMEDQDRSRWDRGGIDEGRRLLLRAAHLGREPGAYRLQAEIALRHAAAVDAAATPWAEVVALYDALLDLQPSPVVELNRAIAVGFRDGFEAGLAELDRLDAAALAGYHPLPAARADFLRRLGRHAEALVAYDATLALLAGTDPERPLVERRIRELSGRRPGP